MADRWLYSTDGKPAFHQQGRYLCSADSHTCHFYESSGWFYSMKDHKPAFYESNGWLYTPQRQTAYHYGDR
jgi:hypothetical protein